MKLKVTNDKNFGKIIYCKKLWVSRTYHNISCLEALGVSMIRTSNSFPVYPFIAFKRFQFRFLLSKPQTIYQTKKNKSHYNKPLVSVYMISIHISCQYWFQCFSRSLYNEVNSPHVGGLALSYLEHPTSSEKNTVPGRYILRGMLYCRPAHLFWEPIHRLKLRSSIANIR